MAKVVKRWEQIADRPNGVPMYSVRKPSADPMIDEFVPYRGLAETCSIILITKAAPEKCIWKKVTRLPPGVDSGRNSVETHERFPDPLGRLAFYDIVKSGQRILVVYSWGIMKLEVLDSGSDFAAQSEKKVALLFDQALDWRDWDGGPMVPKGRSGFLPVESARIIPAKGSIYVFFESASGKCMLWEASGDEGRLVWTSVDWESMKARKTHSWIEWKDTPAPAPEQKENK